MNSLETAHKHYLNPTVQKEIADFCRGRWAAIHLMTDRNQLTFRRYFQGKPLTINKPEDIQNLMEKLGYKVKAFYATANIYKPINQQTPQKPSLYEVTACTPTWDLDSQLTYWRDTIKTAQRIVETLESFGVERSVYIKWSGNGCHIHIHEQAISEEALSRAHPLDLAYAIVEYINIKLAEKPINPKVKVENRMDAGRVFTCPLSLHRNLETVCICMKPNELEAFTQEWIKPAEFRHNEKWREFKHGEADELAIKAYELIGGYPKGRRRKTKKLDHQIMEWLNRF
ncbi:hypothetical protein H5T51_03985 [Candidatus Bathyarchaeota archaeon]|nr:hypothetical protein [Candidatus Bathyarchaeota archaeon]